MKLPSKQPLLAVRKDDKMGSSSRPARPGAHVVVDHSLSEQDQTAADSDQTASDSDQGSADRDQAASEADQRASDEDQGVADRELEADPSPGSDRIRAHDQAHTTRGVSTMARISGTAIRSQVGARRDENAQRRDGIARRRDEIAAARDREAEELEDSAERMAEQLGKAGPAAKVAAIARASAAAGRAAAAKDRERAAGDREDAARDRELLIGEIERYDMDESTETYGRRLGEILLRHEVKRAVGTGGAVTLAVLTVGLVEKSEPESDDASFSAEDRDLALALRTKLSPLDLLVRWREGEFVCAVTAVVDSDVSRLFEEASADFLERHGSATLEIGWAVPVQGESLDLLLERAKRSPGQRSESTDRT